MGRFRFGLLSGRVKHNLRAMNHVTRAREVFEIEIAGLKAVRGQLDEAFGAAVEAKEIPALPLESRHQGDEIGDEVTMLSYPNGTDRLLAVIQVAERQRLLKRFGESSPELIRHFARRKMIKPLMSRGQVMDLYDNRIVFGGTNAEGSSGAPLFGPSGRVIGINFGYFMQNESMNYAVPVDRAITLLLKAGWKYIE